MTNTQQQFAALVQTHKGIIHRVLNNYAPQAEHEDLKQDILTEAWKSFTSFRGECKFSTWLFQVARNTAITRLRKISSRIKTVSYDNPFYQITADSVADRDYNVVRSLEFLHEVRLKYVFGNLNDRDRDLIILYASGYSYDEMSEQLGETANNLRVRVGRIKERLNKKFANKPLSIYD